MKPSDYKISLDILESQSQYSLPMKKGDTARVVYITLREGGVPYEIGTDCFAVLSGRKPDGTVLENNCVIKGNTIIYEITPQTTSASGLVDCEIKLYGVDNGLICSARFSIIVDERAVGDEEIESTSEFSALTKLYSETVEIDNALKEAVESGYFKGEKGDKGDKGEQGEQGIQGVQGEKGDKGDMPSLDDIANAVKSSASGNPAYITDASPVSHALDVKTNANETVYVRGKNLIPFDNKSYYHHAANSQFTFNGITYNVNDDGSIHVKGTATNASFFAIYNNVCVAGVHTVTLSGCPEGASLDTYYLQMINESGELFHDYGNGITVENTNISSCCINIRVANGATVDAKFYPMLEFGDTASEFVSPVGSCFAIADENGIVNGLVSVAKEMNIFTETGASVECTYNQDTNTVQSDMNENDESNPAFIKNRTHWKEVIEREEVILYYVSSDFTEYGEAIGLIEGETYHCELYVGDTLYQSVDLVAEEQTSLDISGVIGFSAQGNYVFDGVAIDTDTGGAITADNAIYKLASSSISKAVIQGKLVKTVIHKLPKEYYDIPEVDQKYNPESTNAQSGIAIEEKLNIDVVPYLDKTTFEVLCDTVLTDAVGNITIDKKSNGEALRCRRFIIFLTIPSKHDWTENNGVDLSAYYNAISKVSMVHNQAPYLKAEENKPFYLEGYFEIFPTGSFSSLVGSTTDGDGHDNIYPIEIPLHSIISPNSLFDYYEGHTGKIVIEAPTGKTFPSNTKIKIWGECL